MTVYDDEHMGGFIGMVVHFTNDKTEHAQGGVRAQLSLFSVAFSMPAAECIRSAYHRRLVLPSQSRERAATNCCRLTNCPLTRIIECQQLILN